MIGMGNVTTSATVDTLALSYTTGHAPLTIIGPDADGNTVIESSALSADDLATAIDIAGRTAITDKGDGTGTRTTYDEHGNETSVEQVTGLPIPEQATEAPDPFEAFSATLRAQLAGATTIAKMRSALTDALDDFDAALG